jgi:hypothetical protein
MGNKSGIPYHSLTKSGELVTNHIDDSSNVIPISEYIEYVRSNLPIDAPRPMSILDQDESGVTSKTVNSYTAMRRHMDIRSLVKEYTPYHVT